MPSLTTGLQELARNHPNAPASSRSRSRPHTSPTTNLCSNFPAVHVDQQRLPNNSWWETILREYTAMTPEQLRQRLYEKPFQPFRVHLKDGRNYEIRHPNLGLAAEAVFIIGIPV